MDITEQTCSNCTGMMHWICSKHRKSTKKPVQNTNSWPEKIHYKLHFTQNLYEYITTNTCSKVWASLNSNIYTKFGWNYTVAEFVELEKLCQYLQHYLKTLCFAFFLCMIFKQSFSSFIHSLIHLVSHATSTDCVPSLFTVLHFIAF